MPHRAPFSAGDVRSIEQPAQVSGQTKAYAQQLLALAFLAPDITEAILLGDRGLVGERGDEFGLLFGKRRDDFRCIMMTPIGAPSRMSIGLASQRGGAAACHTG
jgi:hypothetical protein